MHAAGAGIERDMAAQDNQGIAIVERVGAALSFQTLGVDLGQDPVVADSKSVHASRYEVTGKDQDIIVAHMGLTTAGSIGAQTAKTLEECVPLIDEIAGTASTLPSEAYVIQNDPFFDGLRAWGPAIWQLWEHNKDVPGAAPYLMTETNAEVTIKYTLDLQINDETRGTVDVDPDENSYEPGTLVTLTAAAIWIGVLERPWP